MMKFKDPRIFWGIIVSQITLNILSQYKNVLKHKKYNTNYWNLKVKFEKVVDVTYSDLVLFVFLKALSIS